MSQHFTFPSCPLPPGSSVWAYLRDSGGGTQDLGSQRAYLLAYCDYYRLTLIRLFEDGAVSGGSVVGRDQFELMITLARSHGRPAVDAVLFWDIKRFARNQLDSQFFKADLRKRGYRLVSLSDDIPDSGFSSVIEAFLEWKAEQDLADIGKDSRRGLLFIVGLKGAGGNYIGIFPGRPPTCFRGEPYDTGLRRNDGRPRIVQRLAPDSETWARGQRAFEMRAERASYDQVQAECRLFHARYVSSCYHSFFRNEIYLGRLRYGGHVFENFVSALTTPEIWEAVQKLFYKQPRKGQTFPVNKIHPKTGRAEAYLLSGLCRCAFCQSAVHGNRNTRKDRQQSWRNYVCAKKKAHPADCPAKQVSARRLEQAVVEAVCSKVLTTDFVGELVNRVNDLLSNTEALQSRIQELTKQSNSLDRKIANLLDTAEQHGASSVLERLRERERERTITLRELNHLQEQIKQRSIRVDEKFIVALLTDMKMALSAEEINVRRKVLQQVVQKIEVGHNKARLYYTFPTDELWDYFMPPTLLELIPTQVYELVF
jgi:site-specific DNA recombinase